MSYKEFDTKHGRLKITQEDNEQGLPCVMFCLSIEEVADVTLSVSFSASDDGTEKREKFYELQGEQEASNAADAIVEAMPDLSEEMLVQLEKEKDNSQIH